MTTWRIHVEKWKDCKLCPLHQQRDNIVFARAGVVGGPSTGEQLPCPVLFIGEAPGASEDALGLPFVGPAGDLLQQIIERALPTGTAYALTNLVCCYPRDAKARGDNEPEHGEIEACRPRLTEFVSVARPKLVVFVGTLAESYGPWAVAPGTTRAGGAVEGHQTLRRWTSIVHPAHILARLPLAQKHMAINKSIVVIRGAYENMLQ